jgi:hypothetical protein
LAAAAAAALAVHSNEPNSTTILETAGQLVRKDGQIVSLDYQMQFFFDAQGKVRCHRAGAALVERLTSAV